MHIVIFGLTISSSWGNGHATLWRSLVKAMLARNHTVSFYERDVPYYRQQRDLHELPTGRKASASINRSKTSRAEATDRPRPRRPRALHQLLPRRPRRLRAYPR